MTVTTPDGPPRVRTPAARRLAAGGAALVAGYVLYRVASASLGDVATRAAANAHRILRVQRKLGLAVEDDLQASPLGDGVAGSALAAFYALAYWPIVGTAVLATFVWHRARFRLLRNALAVTGAIGIVVIGLLPVAPPRLLGTAADPVGESPVLGSIAQPPLLFNPYAAMPSFHVAWTLLAVVSLSPLAGRGRRALAALPGVMALAVVTTGNHWIADVAAGLLLAGAGWSAARPMQSALDRARRRRLAGR